GLQCTHGRVREPGRGGRDRPDQGGPFRAAERRVHRLAPAHDRGAGVRDPRGEGRQGSGGRRHAARRRLLSRLHQPFCRPGGACGSPVFFSAMAPLRSRLHRDALPARQDAVTGRRGFTLPDAIRRLRRYYGRPAPPATTDPFELILMENVAYLASIEERRSAFEQLERTVGTSPRALLQASRKAIERVTSKGILREKVADKLRECARIALERFDG